MSRVAIILITLSLFSCISRGSDLKNEYEIAEIKDKKEITLDMKLNEAIFLGTIVAYGSEPNIIWMIKDLNGNLYFPKGELQVIISKLPHLIYRWKGELKSPISLPGLIPENIGHFTEISWELVED